MDSFKRLLAAIGATGLLVGLGGATAAIAIAAPDAITVIPDSGTGITVVEGNSAGNHLVGTFTDTGNAQPSVNCSELYVATIDWGDGSSDTGTVSCERDTSSDHVATGVFDVFGHHAYADSGSYGVTVTVVDNSESGESSGAAVRTENAAVSDTTLRRQSDNSGEGSYAAREGQSISVVVVFSDQRGFPAGVTRDTSITGTIDWGDGTVQTVAPTAPSSYCDCSGPFELSASHVYDAAIPATTRHHITVTARDDGGQTAEATFQATISDGTLTADANKSLAGVATTALTSVVGSFTDEAAAQAAVADFAATINWGDSATSSGTITKTASGAFSVSGTHTYASAGTKSITATVTDEEGSTVTLHATATIAAAPIILPATGHASPTQPGAPGVLLGLLLLGLASLAAGGRIVANGRSRSR